MNVVQIPIMDSWLRVTTMNNNDIKTTAISQKDVCCPTTNAQIVASGAKKDEC